MIEQLPNLSALQKVNQDAHQELFRVSNDLIAIASAISIARSNYSDDDEWTKHDQLISQLNDSLYEILYEKAILVANAKAAKDAATKDICQHYNEQMEARDNAASTD